MKTSSMVVQQTIITPITISIITLLTILTSNSLSSLIMLMNIHQMRWTSTIPDHDDQMTKTTSSLTSLTTKDTTGMTPAEESNKSKLDSKSGHTDTLAAAEDNSHTNINLTELRNSTHISSRVWDVLTQVISGNQKINRKIRCLNTAMSICINISDPSFIFNFINKNYFKLFSCFIYLNNIPAEIKKKLFPLQLFSCQIY